MFRKKLLAMLVDRPVSVSEIARETGERPRDVADHLRHVLRTARRQGYRPVVEPAECRKCGFRFREDKLVKPGKCPKCHATWIEEARVSLVKAGR